MHLTDEPEETGPALHADRAQRALDGAEYLQLVVSQTPAFTLAPGGKQRSGQQRSAEVTGTAEVSGTAIAVASSKVIQVMSRIDWFL